MATTDLLERARTHSWYHVMELAPGEVTDGWFDLRPFIHHYGIPERLDGLRVLEVGTWDGFWAFELERRGAAEVVAIDVLDPAGWDWPAGDQRALAGGRAALEAVKGGGKAFARARAALGSRVERRELRVQELATEELGSFDLVFLGDLLLHLRDPVGAIERVHSVCTGELVVADVVELVPTLLRPRLPLARLEARGRPWWWLPNRAALERVVESAGFEIVARSGLYFVPLGPAHPRPGLAGALRSLASPGGREQLIGLVRGIPHAAVRARPLP
jgi:tRNA (mo5U34)-methyltransferase